MKYAHLFAAVAGEPWAIHSVKGQAILDFLILAELGEAGRGSELEMRVLEAKKLHPGTEAKIARSPGGVAIIPIHGVMAQRMGMLQRSSGGASSDAIGRQVTAAADNSEIKAIVLHVESPGGAVFGLRELADRIHDAKAAKPVIAQVDSYAASAAYWAASQASEVVISPGGEVGSIGVLSVHEDISRRMEAEGVTRTIVSAGKFKVEGNPYQPLEEEARATLQARVDSAHADFLAAVARGRGVEVSHVAENYGQGRMIGDSKAVSLGMADRIATLDQTLQRFAKSDPGIDTRRARLAIAEIT